MSLAIAMSTIEVKLLLKIYERFKVLICKLLDHVTLTVESFFVTMFQICGVMSHDETNKIWKDFFALKVTMVQ